LHVLDLGAAPTVDRLVVVADHEHATRVPGEQAHESVLDRVGVLEFVDQQFAEALAVMRQQRTVVAQQFVRAQQQFGEVDQPGAVAAFLVQGVRAAHDVGPRIGAGLQVLRTPAFVLLRIDPPCDLPRREACFVQFQLLHDALDQTQLVVAVQHLEPFGQLRVLPVQAQQAMRQAVEGADPHARAPAATARCSALGARAHLAGGLVGERHRKDAVRRHAVHLVEPGDAVGEHAGLAGTGAGEDQVVTGRCGDGLALRRIQRVEQVRNIHRPILRGRGGGSRLQELRQQRLERLRASEQVALQFVAAAFAQPVQLFFGLHAFGDDAQVQVVAQPDDRGTDRRVVGVVAQVLDEGPVDLQPVDRQALEVRRGWNSRCRSRPTEMPTPSDAMRCIVSIARSGLSMITLSVISSSSTSAGNANSSTTAATSRYSSWPNCAAETLTEIRTRPRPVAASSAWWRAASRSTKRPSLDDQPAFLAHADELGRQQQAALPDVASARALQARAGGRTDRTAAGRRAGNSPVAQRLAQARHQLQAMRHGAVEFLAIGDRAICAPGAWPGTSPGPHA
jgi:hypothetical protein